MLNDVPQVGDRVFYVPDCEGDRCAHPPAFDRAAVINKVHGDGLVGLTVFHPEATATLPCVRHGGPGQLGSWYYRHDGRDATES